MANAMERTQSIRNFIVKKVGEHPADIASVTAREFGLSRQSVNRRLRKLVDGWGSGSPRATPRAREYHLHSGPSGGLDLDLAVDQALQEDEVLEDVHSSPTGKSASENVIRICQYGFTEMLNNVIDHSESNVVHVAVEWQGDEVWLYRH